jgi:aspartyl-tRNA(Asn)/glutamyl-tRNA(Gln) amidotransferase subunit A
MDDGLEDCLRRIARRNANLGAMVVVDEDRARHDAAASAQRRRDGRALSALDGVPVAVKANIAVAGRPLTAGIAAYRSRLAAADATCVARLRAAGAIIIGLTNMDEGALGATTDNPWSGRTGHPHVRGFTAGGSSGGSAAAVAAGFCTAALGTDTIGSIRIPAAYCGVFGHKPAHGVVPTDGVVPLSPALDHVGVLARNGADCRAVTEIIADADYATVATLAGATIAVLDWPAVAAIEPAVAAAFAATMDRAQQAGARLVTTTVDTFPFARMQRLLFMLAEIDGAAVHATARRDDPAGFSPALTALLDWGGAVGVDRRLAIVAEIAAHAATARAALAGCDALLLPATPQAAFSFDRPLPRNQSLFATLGSCLGWPATAFPVGATPRGLPLGAELVAPDGAAGLAYATALAIGDPLAQPPAPGRRSSPA